MYPGFARLHCIQNCIVNLNHTRLGRFAQADRTCHIGTIAFIASTRVNGDEFTALDTALTGMRMGHRAIRPGSDDGFKRWPICAQRYHVVRDLQLHFFFRHTRLNPLADMCKGFIRDGDGAFEQFQFMGLLQEAQRVHNTVIEWMER